MAGLPPFSLIPPDDPSSSADDDLAAAAAGALAVPLGQTQQPDDPVIPFGRSWQFDWETGQFIREGAAPADTSGFGALREWCEMAIHSARYAHAVFSDEFGMEDPDELLGNFAEGEVLADWQSHLVDALLVHDRIVSVENFDIDWDPVEGLLLINSFDVVTDEDETVTVSDLTLRAGDA